MATVTPIRIGKQDMGMTITVKVVGLRLFRIRLAALMVILKVAAWVSPVPLEVGVQDRA